MKIKLIKFISVLVFALVFVLPVASVSTEAKSRHSEFSEGDRDPPFVCKQVQDPNLSKKRNGLSATNSANPKAREYEDATGEQNTLVVFVAFADQTTNDSSELEEKASEALFGGEGSESASEYFKGVSQRKMLLGGEVLSGWVILPKNSAEYGYGQSVYDFDNTEVFNDTIAATDDRVYFPDFVRIIIFVKGEKTYMMGSLGKWKNIESDDGLLTLGICWLGERNVDSQNDLRHEISHTLGFRHSGAIYLKDNDACERLCSSQEITKADDTTWPPLECSTEEYGDGLCVLGHGSGHPSAFIKYKLGWLNDDQVLFVTESTTVTLIPRASSLAGIKMIIVKAKDADGTKTYFLEYYKRLTGFDSTNKNGTKILLRFFNEEEELNDSGTILLLKKNETEDSSPYITLNLKEESFCDQENGIEINFITESAGEEMAEENSYAELQITLSCPEEKAPAVSVSPDYTQTLAGENVMTEISVANEMAMGCGTRTVNVETTLPNANWSAVFSPSSTLELGPGEAGTITAAIWVPETAAASSYGATFKATDEGSGLGGEARMTIEVLRPPPTPTPIPTPIPNKEMTLFVTINGVDATNSIVVARKSWMEVKVEARDSEGEILRADEVACELTKSNGKMVYKNRPNGLFRFKVGKRGKCSLEIGVSEEGYQTAFFQTKFKVQ